MCIRDSVICGNDLLASGMKVAEYCPEWDEAAAVLCRGMKQKAVKQFAVVGGSSTCWSYASWMSDSQQALYDETASRLCARFESLGMRSCTGADELRFIQTSDDIGHVDESSKAVVHEAYVAWAFACASEVEPLLCDTAGDVCLTVEQIIAACVGEVLCGFDGLRLFRLGTRQVVEFCRAFALDASCGEATSFEAFLARLDQEIEVSRLRRYQLFRQVDGLPLLKTDLVMSSSGCEDVHVPLCGGARQGSSGDEVMSTHEQSMVKKKVKSATMTVWTMMLRMVMIW